MSLINFGTLPTQLQTILNGLDLPNEELTRLATLLKTSLNAGADTSALVTQLESLIDTSTGIEDVALLILALDLISQDMIVSVPTLEDLNNPNIAPGSVFFVESQQVPYIRKSDNTWVLIDPSLQTVVKNAYAWGFNGGRLGDNTTVAKSSPVSVVGGFTDWIQVSAGGGHSLGLRANGVAYAWGLGSYGRLGDGTTVAKSSPVAVVGGFTDWVQVSAGINHSLGLRANGVAYAWGAGTQGKLGDGTVVDRSSPVSVVGGFTDWIQLSAELAQGHSLGLRANGVAYAWGSGVDGRLGDGTTAAKSSPVSVVGGFTDWVQLDTGGRHSLGIRANGVAYAWGRNVYGRLGDDTTVAKTSPVSVVGGFTDWVQVSGGGLHSLGLRSNGTAWAWGFNREISVFNGSLFASGQLGDGTTVDKSSPVSVVGGFTDWVQVSGGDIHSLGLRTNGTAYAWGNGTQGKLGDGTTVNKSSPVSVVGGFTDWVQVSSGYRHSLGLRA